MVVLGFLLGLLSLPRPPGSAQLKVGHTMHGDDARGSSPPARAPPQQI